MSSIKQSEIEEMKALLELNHYNPLHAYSLAKEGMGPHELAQRLRNSPTDLERTHGFIHGAAPSATGQVSNVARGLLSSGEPSWHNRQPSSQARNRTGVKAVQARFRAVRAAAKKAAEFANFDLIDEMETGYCISDDYRVSYCGRFMHDARGWEQALHYVAALQEKQGDFSNVFYVNERGNVDLIVLKKTKPYYKTLHSWV